MNHLPAYISIVFILVAFLTVFLFYKASGNNRTFLFLILLWMGVQAVVAQSGFFTVTDTIPPRLLLLLALPLLSMALTFFTVKGRSFVDRFDMQQLSILHTIRIAVEIVLFLLYLNKALPRLMTFEGRNFDLLAGSTAPLIYYYGFKRRTIGKGGILAWNIISLVILLFTVFNAILSAPTPFQEFGFEQPTVAVLYFPFVWLPGVVVPIIIMSHLVSIRSLLSSKTSNVFGLSTVGK